MYFLACGETDWMLLCVTCLAVPYFFTLPHNRHIFRKKKKILTQNLCFGSLKGLTETILILRIMQRDVNH
jgi:hypothetical protein